ncbi:MAG TPA: YfhO family protein [Thermoleophilaceae bacterium]|nr:YfhO family protein [Thermoleophilaceae bacterium]
MDSRPAAHRSTRAAARLGPAILFALLALILFAPAVVGGKVLSGGDALLFHTPFADIDHPFTQRSNAAISDAMWVFNPDQLQVRDALRSGRLPIWTPELSAGRPLLAAQQSAPLFPLNWLAVVFPYWESQVWIAVLKLTLAALGAFLFCRALGLGAAPALLGGVTFGFATYMVIWLAHPHSNAYLLIPWLFLLAERLSTRGRAVDLAALGFVLGLAFLGGHPESALIVTLPAAAWIVFRLASSGLPSGEVWRRLGLATGAGVLGLAIGAVMLLPFLEALGQSNDTSRGGDPLDFKAILSVVFPEYWHRPDRGQQLTLDEPSNFLERTAYFGALPTLFALAGLFARRPPASQVFFAALGGTALLIAFDSGPVNDLVREIPVLAAAQLNRMLILLAFAGAVLAAYGLQRLLEGTPGERRRMLWAGCLVAFLPPLAWLAANPSDLGAGGGVLDGLLQRGASLTGDQAALWSVLRWLLVAGAAAVVLAIFVLRPRHRQLLAGAAVALATIDLLAMGFGFHPAVERTYVDPEPPPAIEAMRRLTAEGGRVAGNENDLGPNTATRFGLSDARSHDLPVIERYQRLWSALGGASGETGGQRALVDERAPETPKLLSLFGVRAFVTGGRGLDKLGYPVAYAGPDGIVARNPEAVPRAFVAYDWRPSPSLDAAVAVTAVDETRSAVERPVIEGAGPPPERGPAPSVARIHDEADTSLSVTVDARAPGQLILLDTFYPGWRAEVDGRETRIRPANAAFRAVEVPAGRHEVRFSYRPASVYAGLALTLAALLGVAGVAALHWRRRRA